MKKDFLKKEIILAEKSYCNSQHCHPLNKHFKQQVHPTLRAQHYLVPVYCMMHLDMIMTAIQPVGDCNIY